MYYPKPLLISEAIWN